MPRTAPGESDTSRIALGPLLALAGLNLVAYLLTSNGYGIFRDELYYLACTEHLDFGYVDQPPLSILLLWLSRTLLGENGRIECQYCRPTEADYPILLGRGLAEPLADLQEKLARFI